MRWIPEEVIPSVRKSTDQRIRELEERVEKLEGRCCPLVYGVGIPDWTGGTDWGIGSSRVSSFGWG